MAVAVGSKESAAVMLKRQPKVWRPTWEAANTNTDHLQALSAHALDPYGYFLPAMWPTMVGGVPQCQIQGQRPPSGGTVSPPVVTQTSTTSQTKPAASSAKFDFAHLAESATKKEDPHPAESSLSALQEQERLLLLEEGRHRAQAAMALAAAQHHVTQQLRHHQHYNATWGPLLALQHQHLHYSHPDLIRRARCRSRYVNEANYINLNR